ncbi:MAG: TetR/AcrR family transcriptional regulator [Alphaproteobacteria bacterium]|nr:TetR/AcrR family transcriptional regulator [Alphaproteobacteria bacterium]
MLDSISPQTKKTRILDAAEDVVMSLGAAHLTFDELVKQTGLSKGGILYHYPSKKALLRAMVQRMIDSFEEKRLRIAEEIEQTGLVGVKTYILASFEKSDRYHQSSTAVMAAAANDPELLEVVKEHYKRNFAEIRAFGKNSVLAMLIFLAVDGVWMLDSLQLCTLDEIERNDLKRLLLNMADKKNN